MVNRRSTKGVAVFICLLFCFAMVFSVFFIAEEADHDCTGEDCPICAEIRVCANVLGSAAIVPAATAVCSILPLPFIQPQRCYDTEVHRATLVSLNVKLSN